MKTHMLAIIFIIFVSGCVDNVPTDKSSTNITSTANISNSTSNVSLSVTAGKAEYVEKFMVANPLDLSQVESISKFRSCAGHDTPGYNAANEREYNRSMKHYISPTDSARSSGVKIFSPFDGKIYMTMAEDQRGSQIYLQGKNSGEWYFVIYHADLASGLAEGSEIKAGQLVAHAVVGQESDFDIGIETAGAIEKLADFDSLSQEEQEMLMSQGSDMHLPKRNSMFYHMSDDVYMDFAEKGLTLSNIIISKPFRDQNPCKCVDEDCYFDTPHTDPSNWVFLR